MSTEVMYHPMAFMYINIKKTCGNARTPLIWHNNDTVYNLYVCTKCPTSTISERQSLLKERRRIRQLNHLKSGLNFY